MKRIFGILLVTACIVFGWFVSPGHGIWIFVWTAGLMGGIATGLAMTFPGKRIDQ